MEVNKITGKIIEQVLIHVNQYDELDAHQCFKDEEGSELWEEITKILNKGSSK